MLDLDKGVNDMRFNDAVNKAGNEIEKLKRILQEIKDASETEDRYSAGEKLLKTERKLLSALTEIHEINREEIDKDIACGMYENKTDFQLTRFDAKLEVEDGIYHFTLPPLRPQYYSYEASADHIHRELIRSLLIRNGYEQIEERAAIVMIHDLDENIPASRIPDYDNLRTKAVIDAIGMKLIPNDNLLSILVISFGRRREKSAFHLYVMPEKKLKEWTLQMEIL